MEQKVVDGCSCLVEALDAAVGQQTDVEAVTEAVRRTLVSLIHGGEVDLPEGFCRPASDHYARRLVHRDPQDRYSVVAMVWGPEQGTALHDHSGMWCVEGVWQGRIQVEQYSLVERSGGRYRFRREDSVEAGVGSAGCLIPPFEYHTIANARSGESSITIHVYGGEMTRCSIFEPQGDGWYQATPKQLGYTD